MRQLVPVLYGLGIKPCAGYYGCQINEMIAICERHVKPTPVVTFDMFRIYCCAYRRFGEMWKAKPTIPHSQERVLLESPQSRRSRIRLAYDSINRNGFPWYAERVNSFVKWEKFEDAVDDPLELKSPRLIQYRSYEYCYELARYMRPLEHRVFGCVKGQRVPYYKRWFIKGMNSWQVAANILYKYGKYANPVIILLDHSKYDAHLNIELRMAFHRWVKRNYPNDSWLAYLLHCQLRNKCKSRNGISYSVEGTMFSGEYNTSFEDSVTNLALMMEFMSGIDYEIGVNGDDSYIILEANDLSRVDFDFWQRVGLSTKYEVVWDIADIEFCQCKPVRVGGTYRMVRNPMRVLARTGYTCKTMTSSLGYKTLLGSIALGELHCNSGVPVLEAWARLLLRSAEGRVSQALYQEYMSFRPHEFAMDIPITQEARVDFEISFGIRVEQQLELEKLFEDMQSLPMLE